MIDTDFLNWTVGQLYWLKLGHTDVRHLFSKMLKENESEF